MSKETGRFLVGYTCVKSKVGDRAFFSSAVEAHLRKQELLDKWRRVEASRRPVKWRIRLMCWIIERA